MGEVQVQSALRKTAGDVLILLFLGTVIFLPRLHELPYKGEEPRRVICAQELLLSGNFFVPTIQGELFLSRPPLQNWVIALTGVSLGNFGHLAGRLPSFFAVLAVTLLIYFYCRTFFTGTIPLLAGLLFLSTLHVLRYGGLAETEMLFTFFLAGSYLFWHLAEHRGWPNTVKWPGAYLLLTGATLSKGFTQAPLYFCAIIGLHLFLNKRLSNLLTWGHAAGLTVFLVLFGIWQIGFSYYAGWEATQTMFLGDVAMRFEQRGISTYLEHWFTYPFEQFAVMLPWSIFLLAFLSKDFRNRLKPFPAPVTFCLGAVAITFLSVWFPPGAKTRYYIPMIPCFVILSAVVLEQCRIAATEPPRLKASWFYFWSLFQKFFTVAVYSCAPLCCLWGVCVNGEERGGFADRLSLLFPVQNFPLLLFFIACISIIFILRRLRNRNSENAFIIRIVAFVLFSAAAYNFLFIGILKTKYEDVDSYVIDVLQKIPANAELHSIGPIDFPFVYYYMLHTGKILPIKAQDQKFSVNEYFCISEDKFSQWNHGKIEIIAGFNTRRFKPIYSKEKISQMFVGKIVKDD